MILAATAAIGEYVRCGVAWPSAGSRPSAASWRRRDRPRRRCDSARASRPPSADALFGLGYVHAQDRLWQMEFQRRIGFGRLSEIFGTATIPQDRFLRTVGFGRAARAAWQQTPDWAKRADQRLHRRRERVHQHASRRARCRRSSRCCVSSRSRGRGADVAVWVKMMAWDLSANYSFELLRDRLACATSASSGWPT